MAKEVAKMKAAEGRIRRRVELSKELVQRMGISPEAYVRVAVNAFVVNPQLVECSDVSIDKCLLRCIEIGLLPDGKHAAMIPFKREAQLVVMVDGKATLARRALPGLALRSRVVYQGEHFVHEEGLHAVLEHRPDPTVSHDDADIHAVYAVADLPGGSHEFVVLYRPDIERARGHSRSRGGPWGSGFYREMAEKTALHRVLKRLPTVADSPPDFDELPTEPEEPRIMGGPAPQDVTGLRGNQPVTDAERQREAKLERQAAEGDDTAEPVQGKVEDAGVDGASDAFDKGASDDNSPF